MKNYRLIIFDLDGTLTDSAEGIINSLQYALNKIGQPESNRERLRPFLGPPLMDSFQEFYHFDHKTAWQAVVYYREYYSQQGIFENTLYPGIKPLLSELKEHNKLLALATTKPAVYARQILDGFNILQYFDFLAGSNFDGSMMDKAELIAHVLGNFNQLDLGEVVMIGDRKYDIEGAKANKIDSIAVTYGYGTREELLNSTPVYLAESIKELENLIF